jgi:hypothetical protein
LGDARVKRFQLHMKISELLAQVFADPFHLDGGTEGVGERGGEEQEQAELKGRPETAYHL